MKKIFIAIILITIGAAAIILTVAVLRPPFIEMPWDKEECWFPRDGDRTKVRLEFDHDFGGDVMRLDNKGVSGLKFGFSGLGGRPLVEDPAEFRYFTLYIKSMNKDYFSIVLNLETSEGWRYLEYRLTEGDVGLSYPYWFSYGLGEAKFLKGERMELVVRDIKRDFDRAFPGVRLIRIPSLKVFGDLSISNMRFYSRLPEDFKITEPKIPRFAYDHIYDKDGKKIFLKGEQFDEFGNSTGYFHVYNKHDETGNIISQESYYYTPEGILERFINTKFIGRNDSETKNYDRDMNLRRYSVTRYNGPKVNYAHTYYKKDGTPWIIVEGESLYRGNIWLNSRSTIKSPEGDITKEIDIDLSYDGGYKESRHEVKDSIGRTVLEETRWHNPDLIRLYFGFYGVCFERKFYDENGRLIRITRGRNIGIKIAKGIYASLECDYDPDNRLKEIGVRYYGYKDEIEQEKSWLLIYNNMEGLISLKEAEYDPWNVRYFNNISHFPEATLAGEEILGEKVLVPDNLVIDGDMKFEGIKEFWKPMGKLIRKKTKGVINGKSQKVLRVEKPHDEEELDEEPYYLQQFIPIGGGEYKLSINYKRKSGKAYMGLDWISIEDLVDPNKLVTIEDLSKEYAVKLVDYIDDNSEGLQIQDFIFTTPSGPGLVILKIGAASVVEYSNIDLKPYVAQLPVILDVVSGEIPEFGFEYTQNIGSSLGDSYSFKVQDAKIDSTGGKQYVIQELYKNTPVFGGYIILGINKDDSVMAVEDNTVKIEEPRSGWKSKRTTKGEELHRILKEKIGVRDEDIPKYDAEMVIASKTEDGSPSDTSYGWRITGPGVDRVVEIETGKNLYRIERSTVAPPTKLPHREIREPRFLSVVRGVYIRFREWLINLFQQIKRRT